MSDNYLQEFLAVERHYNRLSPGVTPWRIHVAGPEIVRFVAPFSFTFARFYGSGKMGGDTKNLCIENDQAGPDRSDGRTTEKTLINRLKLVRRIKR